MDEAAWKPEASFSVDSFGFVLNKSGDWYAREPVETCRSELSGYCLGF